MKRRRYLLGMAGTMGLIGGASPSGGSGPAGRGPDWTPPDPGRPTFDDVELPVGKSRMVLGAPRGSIPAITDPAFAGDWSGIDRTLEDRNLVIGVAREGRARAYPLKLLSTHEVVNDDLGGPLLVTYCPLCASGVTAVRRVRGEPTEFSVSGYLFRAGLVMYDHRTGSLWSQIMARAIHGSATGERLTLLPSTLATWADWLAAHPDTEVLLPPPDSGIIRPPLDPIPLAGSKSSGHVGVAGVALDFQDDRLPARELVVGITTAGAAKAYPLPAVKERGVINDWVGELPVVVAADPVPQAYVRWTGEEIPTFERAGDGLLRGGGSKWLISTGEAISGPREGEVLERAASTTAMYWFAWLDFHPETTVYGR